MLSEQEREEERGIGLAVSLLGGVLVLLYCTGCSGFQTNFGIAWLPEKGTITHSADREPEEFGRPRSGLDK